MDARRATFIADNFLIRFIESHPVRRIMVPKVEVWRRKDKL